LKPRRHGSGYIWLRILLAVGSLLGVLLLVQSVATYYQVTSILVTAQLRREAQRQVNFVEQESRRLGIREASQLGPVFDEIRSDSPNKVAWIRAVDPAGGVLAHSGVALGEPVVPLRRPQDSVDLAPAVTFRGTGAGKVLITALPLRINRRPPAEIAARPPGPRPAPQFMEIALYLSSASETFGRLGTNLIISASAALGLVASTILVWLRLPGYVRGKQLERQTDLARQVQMDMLPAADVAIDNLDFAAVCVPALQVGGDFYDVFSTNRNQVAIVLGDVSGKGLPASVLVGLLLGAVRASGWMGGSSEHEAASRRLSELLRTRTASDRFASMFWCYYDPPSQLLRYVNAGHLPPILVKRCPGGEIEIQRLTDGGPVLGLLHSANYSQGSAGMGPGDVLILYSDGISEAENAAGDQFDDERLLAVIRETAGQGAIEIRNEILKRVRLFLHKQEAQDDLTIAVARIPLRSA
jgi:Stage II sporulation protein E (SpoIIE)